MNLCDALNEKNTSSSTVLYSVNDQVRLMSFEFTEQIGIIIILAANFLKIKNQTQEIQL